MKAFKISFLVLILHLFFLCCNSSGDSISPFKSGCMDSKACNYNPEATQNSGCYYPENNVDCDGNCKVEIDICGVCGGGSTDVGNCSLIFDVYYTSSVPIGGFQFSIDGAIIESTSGGIASISGFSISASSTVVIGFSLSGNVIPPTDSNTKLLSLEITSTNQADPICLTKGSIVISDGLGKALESDLDCNIININSELN